MVTANEPKDPVTGEPISDILADQMIAEQIFKYNNRTDELSAKLAEMVAKCAMLENQRRVSVMDVATAYGMSFDQASTICDRYGSPEKAALVLMRHKMQDSLNALGSLSEEYRASKDATRETYCDAKCEAIREHMKYLMRLGV